MKLNILALTACFATASCLGAQEVAPQQSALRRLAPAALGTATGIVTGLAVEKFLESQFGAATPGYRLIQRVGIQGFLAIIQTIIAFRAGMFKVENDKLIMSKDLESFGKGQKLGLYSLAFGYHCAYNHKPFDFTSLKSLWNSLTWDEIYAASCCGSIVQLLLGKEAVGSPQLEITVK